MNELAFALIGLPADDKWQPWQGGGLDWHPSASRFHGAGISERGISFSYQADWEAPGRWAIEVLTSKSRYLLKPMEALQVIPLGEVEPKFIELDSELDQQFKPGIYKQCESFLNDRSVKLCSLAEQLKAFPIYASIAGYSL